MTVSDSDIEAGLRDLRHRVDAVPPPPSDLAQRTRERYRAQRRSRAAVAAGGLVAAVVLASIPVVAATLADAPRRDVAGPSGRTFVPAPPPALYALPTRGSLADDREWLDEVSALDWEPAEPVADGIEVPIAPADTRRVAFADDVPSGRVALVLGIEDTTVVHVWFTGPVGADPEEMVPAGLPGQVSPDNALTLLDAPGPESDTVTLVVVTEPGDTADRATTPVVEASSAVRKERVTIDLMDGIGVHTAAGPWPSGYFGSDIAVRTPQGGDRQVALTQSERLNGDPSRYTVGPDVPPADPRGLAGRSDPDASAWTVGSMVATYGLDPDQARPTLLAAGQLGARVEGYGELYGMTHPSGATSTWVITYAPGRTSAGVTTMSLPPAPAGTDLLDRVIAVQAMAGILVSTPTGVTAQILDASGQLLVTVPLERGAGTAPYNGPVEPATVRVLDGDGGVLAETPVSSG